MTRKRSLPIIFMTRILYNTFIVSVASSTTSIRLMSPSTNKPVNIRRIEICNLFHNYLIFTILLLLPLFYTQHYPRLLSSAFSKQKSSVWVLAQESLLCDAFPQCGVTPGTVQQCSQHFNSQQGLLSTFWVILSGAIHRDSARAHRLLVPNVLWVLLLMQSEQK
jgi:hypothetical protein